MAKLSRDNTSWRASGVERRDYRHSHDGPEVTPAPPRKKNKKRWCKGKEGREHDYAWKRDCRFHLPVFTKTCRQCKRIEERCWGHGGWLSFGRTSDNCDCPRKD